MKIRELDRSSSLSVVIRERLSRIIIIMTILEISRVYFDANKSRTQVKRYKPHQMAPSGYKRIEMPVIGY